MPGKVEPKPTEFWVSGDGTGSLTLSHTSPPSNPLMPVIQTCDLAKFPFLLVMDL